MNSFVLVTPSDNVLRINNELYLKKKLRLEFTKEEAGGGHSNPLQYSCLENPMDKGAWWAMVPRVAKSQTQLNNLACMHTQGREPNRFDMIISLWKMRNHNFMPST